MIYQIRQHPERTDLFAAFSWSKIGSRYGWLIASCWSTEAEAKRFAKYMAFQELSFQ